MVHQYLSHLWCVLQIWLSISMCSCPMLLVSPGEVLSAALLHFLHWLSGSTQKTHTHAQSGIQRITELYFVSRVQVSLR